MEKLGSFASIVSDVMFLGWIREDIDEEIKSESDLSKIRERYDLLIERANIYDEKYSKLTDDYDLIGYAARMKVFVQKRKTVENLVGKISDGQKLSTLEFYDLRNSLSMMYVSLRQIGDRMEG